MKVLRNIAERIPLFIRVVSLYAVIWLTATLGVSLGLSTVQSSTTVKAPSVAVVKQVKRATIVSKTIIDGTPQRLVVSRLGVDLPVEIGVYDASSKNWTLSEGVAYFANVSTIPNNQRGNTFIYAHNKATAFAPLASLAIGDLAVITTTNGHTFTYAYTGDEFVYPDAVEILASNPDTPRLTLMTCEGIWSQTRRLMYFDLQEAK